MNELEKKQGKMEIYNYLMNEEDRTGIKWRESFFGFSKMAGICAKDLSRVLLINIYRGKEKSDKEKRKLSRLVYKYAEETLNNTYNQMKINPDADTLYFPGRIDTNEYFQNSNAVYWVSIILHPEFKLPDNLEEDLVTVIKCAWGLRGAFYSLGCGCDNGIPIKVCFKLFETLNDLVYKTTYLIKNVEEREKKGDQNSQNSSTKTYTKLTDCRKHTRYPELLQYIKSCDDPPKQTQVAKMNRILKDVLGTENKCTLRKFRHIFWKEIKG